MKERGRGLPCPYASAPAGGGEGFPGEPHSWEQTIHAPPVLVRDVSGLFVGIASRGITEEAILDEQILLEV